MDIHDFRVWPNPQKPDFTSVWPLAVGVKRYYKELKVTQGVNYGFHSIHIISKGKVSLNIDSIGENIILSEGDMFALWPGYYFNYNGYLIEEESSAELYWLRLGGEKIEEYLKGMGFVEKQPVLKAEKPLRVTDIFEEIYKMTFNYANECDIKAISILYELISNADYNKKSYTSSAQLIQRIKYFMNHEVERAFNIQQICEVFNVSRSTLYSSFKNETGMNPLEYLEIARITKACRLLEATDLPISRIAEACGFSNSHHMIRNFRRLINKTPAQYRKNRK